MTRLIRLRSARCALPFVVGLSLAVNAQAALWNRLETAPGSGEYQAYYDDELDLTWLADANFAKTTGFSDDYSADGSMPWSVANAWAAGLTVEGIGGWRLPQLGPINGFSFNYSYKVDGSSDNGFNISAWRSQYAGSTTNEMAYLFFNTLGNTGFRNLVGGVLRSFEVVNSAPFVNVDVEYYWAETESGLNPDKAGAFGLHGEQGWGSKDFYFRAWPVYDGDIAVAAGMDDDGDGVANDIDNCPNTPNGPLNPDPEGGADQQDDDGDNVGNACDLVVPAQPVPSSVAGNAYSHLLTALRGQAPYSWTLTGGALPANLTLGSGGLISGDTISGGFTANFTVQVTDSTGDTASRQLSMKVKIPNCYACHTATLNQH